MLAKESLPSTLLSGTQAFEDDRLGFNRGRIFRVPDVSEICLLSEAEIMQAIGEGDLAARFVDGRPIFHERDLHEFMERLWERPREAARQRRASFTVRREYEYRRDAECPDQCELRACSHCGTVVIAEISRPPDANDTQVQRVILVGECTFCDRTSYFSGRSAPQATSTWPSFSEATPVRP
jgi:hypothetical protein